MVMATNAQTVYTISEKDVHQLFKAMSGEFSSEAQAKSDTNFLYITLRMKPIWTDKKDGYWLYVEQAVASAQERPYRQRIYHVFKYSDTTIASKVYEIKNPLQYAGGWKDVTKLQQLSTDSLIDRQGCAIYLKKITSDGVFAGSTPEKQCLSSLRGAAYATSDVVIDQTGIISWDRGWNYSHVQVWGSVHGGYDFRKLNELK